MTKGYGFFANLPQTPTITSEHHVRGGQLAANPWTLAGILSLMGAGGYQLTQQPDNGYRGIPRGNSTRTGGGEGYGGGRRRLQRSGFSYPTTSYNRSFRLMGRRDYSRANYERWKKFRCSMVPAGFRSRTPQTAFRRQGPYRRRWQMRRGGRPMTFSRHNQRYRRWYYGQN
jgi:hypothetical protein